MAQDTEVSEGRHLKYGETPFTIRDRQELENLAHMTFIAMKSLYHVVSMAMATEQAQYGKVSSYWTAGVGGAALEQGRQVYARFNEGIDPEQHVPEGDGGNGWFRNAEDLLFDISKHPMLGYGWRVCESCHLMLGSRYVEGTAPCLRCQQPTRPIQWSDLLPWPEEESDDARSDEG